MSGPDVRWEGVSHLQIVVWVLGGRGAQVTEVLEERLTKAAEALTQTADLANATLQRVNAGEWTGNAATVAAQAMQVARDFDDVMGHHGKMGTLAAFGQSDNATWARSSVPPMGSVEPPVPTGSLTDMLNATQDYNDQVKAARDAAEQARRVMRDYESMTTDRVAAMPPLSPPPQIVAADAPDTILVPPGGPGPGTGRDDVVLPRGDDTIDEAAPPRPGGPPTSDPPDKDLPDSDLPGRDPTGSAGPAATTPAAVTDTRPAVTSPVGSGVGGDTPRPGGVTGFVGVPGADGSQRGGTPRGTPGGTPRGAGLRVVTPGVPGGRVGMADARGGAHGMAPVNRAATDEDKDHQVRYGIAGSEIFEPDHVDGLLHDPFRPGSFVAPATIGDDEDE